MTEAEDKEKAEKLAAAKKRFEQLKKQKNKKGGAKKKTEKEDAVEAEPESSTPAPPPEETKETEKEEDAQDPTDHPDVDEAADEAADDLGDAPKASHGRQPSLSMQSMMRSTSFRQASGATSPAAALKSPSMGADPGETAQDIYKKQAQRIEELEKDNKRLQTESEGADTRLQKAEEELEELRESNSSVADLRSKADLLESRSKEIEELQTEITSLNRQITQIQSTASKRRSTLTASPPNANLSEDLTAQLASKSATIESLELSLSTLQAELASTNSTCTKQARRIQQLESQLSSSAADAESAKKELTDLKANLQAASEEAAKEGSERGNAETKIAQLEAELAASKRATEDAKKRTETLEKKVETLTTLHRESDVRSQTRLREAEKTEREAKELRARVTALGNENSRLTSEVERRRKLVVDGDENDDGVEELEEEERNKLRLRIRALEDEVFELRRGVWRDKRRSMQPDMGDVDTAGAGEKGEHYNNGFDDVDLSTASPRPSLGRGASSSAGGAQHSTFADVLNSGISAFTSGGAKAQRRGSTYTAARKQSLGSGLLEDDDDELMEFDEEAFRAAQEEEAKKRIERVKEVKRGLKEWEGWRVDLVEVRKGAMGMAQAVGIGEVFDV
ncbi:hypothetical protein K402DRAFT_454439 [Aulographum hederae CBS 113979]|uniref:M protein repeat protein n=1 Tax=Aulographum hederae CBS 113979 TaxID=1176131 RepID=A0A6G1H0E0_9PEZI|nr:hypothetical protein K402DRAFT_454439 [Aulographum hederae CBS 113979]